MTTTRPQRVIIPLLAGAAVLLGPGCDRSPPSGPADAEIEKAVRTARPDVFRAEPAVAEVVSIKRAKWQKTTLGRADDNAPAYYTADWTAGLRLKEPIGVILAEVDGTRVVKVVAEAGTVLQFSGNVNGAKEGDSWECGAFATSNPWEEFHQRVGPFPMGYQSIGGGGSNMKFRTVMLEGLSTLKPCVVEGSPEEKALLTALAEKQRRAQEEAETRRKKMLEEQAERQRQAQEAYAAQQRRLQEEAAERQRAAEEETKRRAEEARRARYLPMLGAFRGEAGAVISADAGPAMGSIILEARVDEAALTIAGRGIDLRRMPFREFTFEGAPDDRTGAIMLRTTLAADAMPFRAGAGGSLAGPGGQVVSTLGRAERDRIDAVVALGTRLGAAPAVALSAEILDAAAAKQREGSISAAPLAGTVLYRDRNAPTVVGLFAGDLASRRSYTWRNGEVVAVRLNVAGQGKGLYIAGSTAPSSNFNVVVNGVHTAAIDTIPKGGGAYIPLPEGLEVLDVRFEAAGVALSRAIVLVK